METDGISNDYNYLQLAPDICQPNTIIIFVADYQTREIIPRPEKMVFNRVRHEEAIKI